MFYTWLCVFLNFLLLCFFEGPYSISSNYFYFACGFRGRLYSLYLLNLFSIYPPFSKWKCVRVSTYECAFLLRSPSFLISFGLNFWSHQSVHQVRICVVTVLKQC